MKREEMLDWMRAHREAIHGDPERILERAEHDACRHAAQHAWRHAKAIAEDEAESWGHCSPGSHAAEDTVARELCHDLARELRHREPHLDGDEALLDDDTLAALDEEARAQLRAWIGEIAGTEEHRIWHDVVRFTHGRAETLIREGAMSRTTGWDGTHFFSETAVRLAHILAHDYEEQARRVS